MYFKDVRIAQVPKYQELSIKHVMHELADNETVMSYLPDLKSLAHVNSKWIDRHFLFNIINTLCPSFFKQAL